MKRIYAPFGVHVVDVDPGQLPHIEVVVGGTIVDIGRNDNFSGLAPSACTPLLTPVVFVFSATIGNQPERTCEIAAMEAGHTLGLEHEMDCRDPMTHLPACGQKSFQDAAAPCGEQDPRTCSCGGTTQNSYRELLARLGPRVPRAPEVAITRPADGERVLQLFTVGVTASDDGNITRVELIIDGVAAMSDTAWPFDFTAPPRLASGGAPAGGTRGGRRWADGDGGSDHRAG